MAQIKKSIFWDGLAIDFTGLDEIPHEFKKHADAILRLVTEHPNGLTVTQIRSMTTGTTQLQHNALNALLDANKLKKEGEGIKGNPFLYKASK